MTSQCLHEQLSLMHQSRLAWNIIFDMFACWEDVIAQNAFGAQWLNPIQLNSACIYVHIYLYDVLGICLTGLFFLPARRYASAANSDRKVSVRPSVTRRYCVKTKKASVMISSPSGSPKTLVF